MVLSLFVLVWKSVDEESPKRTDLPCPFCLCMFMCGDMCIHTHARMLAHRMQKATYHFLFETESLIGLEFTK